MPLTDKGQARESGFAQVREALQKFEGDVVRAEFGQWGGKLIDDDGKPVPPKEFLEVESANVKVLEVTEELSMAIEEWTFRVNCSEYKGSFWVEDFLESADKHKLLIPDDLVGKRITWVKATRTYDIRGKEVSSTNFIIGGVKAATGGAPKVVSKPIPTQQSQAEEVEEVPAGVESSDDPMQAALELAVGKTEAQFRTALSINPAFVNSPLLPLAKAGAVTTALVNEGRLVLVQEGTKQVYRKPE